MANDLYPGMTTMEEDFRAIGLLAEGRAPTQAPAPAGKPAEEPMDEAARIRKVTRVTKGGKGVAKTMRTHRTSSKERARGKRYRHSHKAQIKRSEFKHERGALGMLAKRRAAKIARKKHMPAPGARREGREALPGLHSGIDNLLSAGVGVLEAMPLDAQQESVDAKAFITLREGYTGHDEVLRLLEDVQKTVSGLGTTENGDIVKAYASLALTAEDLSTYFGEVAEDYAGWGLQAKLEELADVFATLAEDAAMIAKALNENAGEVFDVEGLDEAYRAQFALVLGGANLLGLMEGEITPDDFEDIFEGAAEEDEEEGDEEEGDEEEEPEEECEEGKGK